MLSALIAFHVSAVFVAPMTSSISTATGRLPLEAQPEETPTLWFYELVQPYLDVTYLNHGYGFFAPDPGPSHLVRYQLTYGDEQAESSHFPDLAQHWPRLRYHRYFMLAEQAPPGAGEAYGRHLVKQSGARQVDLQRVRHYLARPEEVLQGRKLDAPETYEVIATSTVRSDAHSTKPASTPSLEPNP